MPSHLLDKSVARRMIEALHHLNVLSFEEEMVLDLWRQLETEKTRLFVPVAAMNILRRFAHLVEVRTFLAAVEPLGSGRYLRRWAHRLREHGFTREDALILALATFGTDSAGTILGVDVLITLDRPFLNNFQAHQAKLQIRLLAMTRQLLMPYHRATLPLVLHPEQILHE